MSDNFEFKLDKKPLTLVKEIESEEEEDPLAGLSISKTIV